MYVVFATKWHLMTYFPIHLSRVCTVKPGLLQGDRASQRGLLLRGKAAQRKARPLKGRPGLSQGGQTSHSKTGPLTGRLGLSQGDWASQREAGPLRGTLGLSH